MLKDMTERVPRLPAFVACALVANFLIFYFIMQLVTNEQFRPPIIEAINFVDFIRFKEQMESPDKIIQEEVEEPPPPDEAPPPPDMIQPDISKPDVTPLEISMPGLDIPMNINGTPFIGDFIKSTKPTAAQPLSKPEVLTNLIPTIKIPPAYPRRALRSGIEGVVIVELTITKDGTVKDPVIVKSDPPEMFDRAVLKVITKWQFNPEIENGEAREVRTRQTVNFQIKIIFNNENYIHHFCLICFSFIV